MGAPANYTKTPETVAAVEWDGQDLLELMKWTGSKAVERSDADEIRLELAGQGEHLKAQLGDYFVKSGSKIFAVKNLDFLTNYTAV